MASDAAVVRGGLVPALRRRRARTTTDVDLRMTGTSAELRDRPQAAGRLELGDLMCLEVQRDRQHPELRVEGTRYAGHRTAAECRLAGNIRGRRVDVGVDVGFGDPLVGEPDQIVGDRLQDFAGIAPARMRLHPVVSQVADKPHARSLTPRAARLAHRGPARSGVAGHYRGDQYQAAVHGAEHDVRVAGDACSAGVLRRTAVGMAHLIRGAGGGR